MLAPSRINGVFIEGNVTVQTHVTSNKKGNGRDTLTANAPLPAPCRQNREIWDSLSVQAPTRTTVPITSLQIYSAKTSEGN